MATTGKYPRKAIESLLSAIYQEPVVMRTANWEQNDRFYVSQSKPSRAGRGKWKYEFFHTLPQKTLDAINSSVSEMILLNYVDETYVRLSKSDLEWVKRNCGRQKSNEGKVFDFVVERNSAGFAWMRPLVQTDDDKKLFVTIKKTAPGGEEMSVANLEEAELVIDFEKPDLTEKAIKVKADLRDLILCTTPSLEQFIEDKKARSKALPVILQIGESSTQVDAVLTKDQDDRSLSFWIDELRSIDPDSSMIASLAPNATADSTILQLQIIKESVGDDEVGIEDPYPLKDDWLPIGEDDANLRVTAHQMSFLDLLDGTSIFVMPMFQRAYSWNKQNFDVLWADIDAVWLGEEPRQFLGAIVTRLHQPKVGQSAAQHWVIDGQQRLTTIYAILAAMTKVAIDADLDNVATNYCDTLFIPAKDDKGRPAIKLTLRDVDNFNKVLAKLKSARQDMRLDAGVGSNPRFLNSWSKHILPAVQKHVTDRSGKVSEAKLARLYEIVCQRLIFMQISVPTKMNPHKVFDRMNTQGVRLSVADLVRNLIFERLINEPEKASQLHRNRMIPFEENFTKEVNGESRSVLDDYYLPFSLTRTAPELEDLTKSNMFSKLRDYWADRAAESVIDELEEACPPYLALAMGMEALEDDDPLLADETVRGALERLIRLDPPSSTYSYLMPLLQSFRNEESEGRRVVECLLTLESYLVRRGFAGFQSAGFQTLFRNMWADCGRKANAEMLFEQIVSRSGYDFPENDAFRQNIRNARLYLKKGLCRFVLNELELEHGPSAGYREFVNESYRLRKNSIEHIIPRDEENWVAEAESWGYDAGEFLDWASEIKDTFANLVLLEEHENAELSNLPWSQKKHIYRDRIKFRAPRAIVSNFEKFDREAYSERLAELEHWALGKWPHPKQGSK